MLQWARLKLDEFLALHPSMRLAELDSQRVVLDGEYELDAQLKNFEPIRETYQLKITFFADYPKSLPIVQETTRRIPRTADYHTYEDGSFCLGSDINLKSILFEDPSVQGFVERVLAPFLYSISYKIKHDIYPFGDLAHGESGLIDDYQRLFNVNGKLAVLSVLAALGKRKRDANKLPCPCGCRARLGECDFRFELERWRKLGRRRWFREHLSQFTPIEH
ncbi:MAG: hypothetical protein HND56_05165 [Pseudomonadota bacterium]|nr:hypothetical protein [Pseudomonadota bacterium]QKK05113.1 MAG: hypothetical protein HND56_05165 [Pseudomonadota bacterium]